MFPIDSPSSTGIPHHKRIYIGPRGNAVFVPEQIEQAPLQTANHVLPANVHTDAAAADASPQQEKQQNDQQQHQVGSMMGSLFGKGSRQIVPADKDEEVREYM